VVVHSQAGVGRGPLIAAAYLITTGKTLEDALDVLRQAGVEVKASAAQLAVVRDFMRVWRERQALEK